MKWYKISWNEYVSVSVPRRWPFEYLGDRTVSEWQRKTITVLTSDIEHAEIAMEGKEAKIEEVQKETPYVDALGRTWVTVYPSRTTRA